MSSTGIGGMTIRDFGYPVDDPRHFGRFHLIVSPVETRPATTDYAHEDDEEEDATPTATTPRPNEISKGTLSEFSLNHNAHLFDSDEESDLTDGESPFNMRELLIPSLKHILHLAPTVDDGLRFDFYFARALYDFHKAGEWEMELAQGDVIVVAFRDVEYETKHPSPESEKLPESLAVEVSKRMRPPPPTPTTPTLAFADKKSEGERQERFASIDSPTQERKMPAVPFKITVPTLLDPDPDEFATHLREFVEYQKVYGDGWSTAMQLDLRGKSQEPGRSRIKISLSDIGLVPSTFIQKL